MNYFTSQKNILVLNGPNLNFLGKRLPEIYGQGSLKDLQDTIIKKYIDKNIKIAFFQTNHEGEIIDKLQEADSLHFYNGKSMLWGVVLNPGAYGHYSYAIRDAIESIDIPVVEVHMSDISNREKFRKNLVLSDVCKKTIIGKGVQSYTDAIDFLVQYNTIL